jgi:hypothetical protein
MYKIFMLIALPVLAVGWVAYTLWERKMRIEEKKQPKQISQRLQKTRSEVSDWAQKMAQFQSPAPKKQAEQDKQDNQE